MLHACLNEDDGCQFAEVAVRGVHFPSVRAWNNPGRRGVPAETDQQHGDVTGCSIFKYKNTETNKCTIKLIKMESNNVNRKQIVDCRRRLCGAQFRQSFV